MLIFAYIGPGAGFAILSSFLVFLLAFLLGGLIFVTAPLRMAWKFLRRRKTQRRGRFRRVVIVGLDGMSPVLARRMLDAGELPNFAALESQGTFQPLATTLPPISPAAWSTFQTGTQPDRHNIFDFLACDRKHYLPVLSSARIEPPRRHLKLGKYRLPLGKPTITLLRKSKPFWHFLGEQGVPSIVLRVPITFPPEKFRGVLLSGMCVPDLRGTQGSFTYFSTASEELSSECQQVRLTRQGQRITTAITGPRNPFREDDAPLKVPLKICFAKDGRSITLELPGERVRLQPRSYSPWVRLSFRAGLGMRIRGIARFYLKELAPELKLYLSPLNIDPELPVLPISHPFVYASYLAKVQGSYATLGLAEDTWALNEHVLDESAFLEQCYDIHAEREAMFFDALNKTSYGLVACVFDITDRVQHTFWQYTPEARAVGSCPGPSDQEHAVEECYRRMDALVGRVRSQLGKDDLLLVVSDHGFAAFHSGLNLNAWLLENGFLTLKDGCSHGGDYFENVDWSRTQAYALGLAGIFVNQAGREGQGIVRNGQERRALLDAISQKLLELVDPRTGKRVVRRVIDARQYYRGPYVDNAPDLFVGCFDGYRVAWKSVTGGVGEQVIEPNEKAWGGDHCIDPELVPGVVFSNQPLGPQTPRMVDVAATVLDAFGVSVPAHMQGKSLLPELPVRERPEPTKDSNHAQASELLQSP